MSFWVSAFIFSEYMPRSRIDRSYGDFIFNFLRNFHTVFHSAWTNLHSHQQFTTVPFSPHPHQQLLFAFILIIIIMTGERWYHIMVLISISLMISNTEHLFMYLLPPAWLLWKKVYSDLLPIRFFVVDACLCFFSFLLLSYRALFILFISSLPDIWFENIFSHSVDCI